MQHTLASTVLFATARWGASWSGDTRIISELPENSRRRRCLTRRAVCLASTPPPPSPAHASTLARCGLLIPGTAPDCCHLSGGVWRIPGGALTPARPGDGPCDRPSTHSRRARIESRSAAALVTCQPTYMAPTASSRHKRRSLSPSKVNARTEPGGTDSSHDCQVDVLPARLYGAAGQSHGGTPKARERFLSIFSDVKSRPCPTPHQVPREALHRRVCCVADGWLTRVRAKRIRTQ